MSTIPDLYDAWGGIARDQGTFIVPQGTVIDDGAGNVTFGSNLYIIQPVTGSYVEILAGTYALADKGVLVAIIPPTATAGSTVTPTVIAWTNDNRKIRHRDEIVLAIRIGTKIFYNFQVPDDAFVPATSVIPIVTSLPGSPVSGDKVILTDSLTVPNYHWQFQYDPAITDAYEWRFIGGIGFHAEADSLVSSASTSYIVIDGTSPSFTVPRAGHYEITFGSWIDIDVSGDAFATVKVGAAAASDVDSIEGRLGNNYARMRRVLCAASDVLVMHYRTPAGTGSWKNRFMNVRPIRVS